MSDLISRQAAIDALREAENHAFNSYYQGLIKAHEIIADLPSAQPKQDREFIKLTVRNSNGRPYYSIIYMEFGDNGVGHDFEGYSSYSLDVISDYLKKYFMLSAQPDLSEAYSKAVFTWLLDYQIRAAEVKGRYTPYEVLSWVINDWRKDNEYDQG